MTYTAIDVGRSLAGILFLLPVLVLPGLALASLTNLLRFDEAPPARRWPIALLAAFALVPWLASTATRFAGLGGALAILTILAGYALVAAWRNGALPSPGRAAAGWGLGWLALVLLATADLDWQGGLYQSALAFDMVKHAATARVIAETGLPHADPFFARPEPANYYYFAYVPAALAMKLSGGLVDGRGAMAGLVFWCGPALYALVLLVFERCRLSPAATGAPLVLLGLLLVTGLDIFPLIGAAIGGAWLPIMDWWNEQVTGLLLSVLWVPHHLAGLMACWLGFMVVADEIERAGGACHSGATRSVEPGTHEHTGRQAIGGCAGGFRHTPVLMGSGLAPRAPRNDISKQTLSLAVAGTAFASALGSSVWVTLAGVLTAAFWLFALAFERRWRAIGILLGAGVCAGALGAPFILELLSGRSIDGSPVAATVRAFHPWDELRPPPLVGLVGRLLLLPLNYGLEFGAFAIASVLFWRGRRLADARGAELARVVTCGAMAGFLLGTFTESTVVANDLGWRALLFLQLAMLVWTAAFILDRAGGAFGVRDIGNALRLLPARLGLLLLLGAAGTVWGLLALRFYVAPGLHSVTWLGTDPKADRALRGAYEWLNAHAPKDAIVQHDPAPRRVFDFGLYGRNPVAVADGDASLFGARRAAVADRVSHFAPIFRGGLGADEVRARAEVRGVAYVVVSRADPVWAATDSWLWKVAPVFANDGARVIAVSDLPKGG